MRRAIEQRADGIAVSIIDPRAFNALTDTALGLGIPVVSYNADGGSRNRAAGLCRPEHLPIRPGSSARGSPRSCPEGDVLLFIATPGQLNIQPRVDGALDAIRDSGRPIHVRVVATGADVSAERRKVEETYRAHKNLRGMFAVDGGSTQAVAYVMHRYGLHRQGVRAGGYDLLPGDAGSRSPSGRLDFTIDQQPYLQGLLPIQQLFLVSLLERPGLSGRHQHRPEVRDAAQRPALPHDSQPLRRQLPRADVPRLFGLT